LTMRQTSAGLLLLALVGAGCAPAKSGSASPAAASAISAHGLTVTAESPPEDVARLLVAALEHSDDAVLAQLVASNRNRADVERGNAGDQVRLSARC